MLRGEHASLGGYAGKRRSANQHICNLSIDRQPPKTVAVSMRILLFHQHHETPDCPSDCRHYTFAEEWAKRHEVTIITSDTWIDRRLSDKFPWAPPGVRVITVKAPYDNRMGIGARARSFLQYAIKAYARGIRDQPHDVIIGTSTPLSAAWIAWKVARIKRLPFVLEVRSLWPDFPIEMGAIRNRRLQRLLLRTEEKLYRSANHVVTISPQMSEHVIQRGALRQNVTTVLNGTEMRFVDRVTDDDVDQLRSRHRLDGKLVVLYAGTFGRANAIPSLIEAARRINRPDQVAFVFVGHGYHEDSIEKAVADVENIRLVAPVPRHETFKWFRTADLVLVPFVNVPSVSADAPSKLFDGLAAQRPVVVTNEGWMKDLVEEHKCGWFVPPESPDALARLVDELTSKPALLEESGRRGGILARTDFDRVLLAREFEDIMLPLATGPTHL